MPLKIATLIAIIGISAAFLMVLSANLGMIGFDSAVKLRTYNLTSTCLSYLPLINLFLSLYLKQK